MYYKTNKLKGKIAENNLTQKEAAKIIGVAHNTFSRKMNGKTPFTLPEARKLADYFGMTVDELFFYNEVDNREQLV